MFVSREHGAALKNIALSVDALRKDYKAFQDIKIPKLLKRPDISEEDKKHLQFMKETKKWFPYIVRHSSLSKLAPNVSEYRLREHAGWSKRSDMVEIYTHTLTGDSAEDILMLYGVNLKDGKKKRNEQLQQEIVGPHCPFCHTVNIPDSQFCSSCHKPLTSVSYNKIMQEAEASKKKMQELEAKQEILQANSASFLRALTSVEVGGKPKVEIITWNATDGSETLFKAAEIARAENRKREREHQQRHHELNQRYGKNNSISSNNNINNQVLT